MKQIPFGTAIILSLGLVACTSQSNSKVQASKVDLSQNKSAKTMNNLISIVEIPTDSFGRAINFYQSVLDVKIEQIEMQGTKMGLFPGEEGAVNVALVNGNDYKPSDQGTLAYLNAGEDLQKVLDKVAPNGGKVIVPKTEIDPENGYFALFTDSEGNRIGLHSYK